MGDRVLAHLNSGGVPRRSRVGAPLPCSVPGDRILGVALLPMRAEVLKGHLDGLLLAALEAGPRHGYAVMEVLREGSGGTLDLPTGTVYPALHRLERAGLVTKDRVGRRKVVRTNLERLRFVRRLLDEYEELWRGRIQRMAALIADAKESD